jgi:uncharacterized spore protein YtfJ
VDLKSMLQSFKESLATTANVKTVFGDPVTAAGKTIIPVARVGYGFGVGSGRRGAENAGDEGGGGGGGVGAVPVGVVEVTPHHTRFVAFGNRKKLLGVFAAGIVVGVLARARCRR